MSVNQDSNLVSRGGMEGLRYVQDYARELLANGWDREALLKMDIALIERNLSPGGQRGFAVGGVGAFWNKIAGWRLRLTRPTVWFCRPGKR